MEKRRGHYQKGLEGASKRIKKRVLQVRTWVKAKGREDQLEKGKAAELEVSRKRDFRLAFRERRIAVVNQHFRGLKSRGGQKIAEGKQSNFVEGEGGKIVLMKAQLYGIGNGMRREGEWMQTWLSTIAESRESFGTRGERRGVFGE